MPYKQTIIIKLEISQIQYLDKIIYDLGLSRSEFMNSFFEKFHKSLRYPPEFKLKYTQFDRFKLTSYPIRLTSENDNCLKEISEKIGVPKVHLLRDIVVDYLEELK